MQHRWIGSRQEPQCNASIKRKAIKGNHRGAGRYYQTQLVLIKVIVLDIRLSTVRKHADAKTAHHQIIVYNPRSRIQPDSMLETAVNGIAHNLRSRARTAIHRHPITFKGIVKNAGETLLTDIDGNISLLAEGIVFNGGIRAGLQHDSWALPSNTLAESCG